ncbi:MAG: MFS transporter [Blastocatellales bacterium]
MKTSRYAPHYAWLLVALLWVIGMLNYLDRQVIFSLFPPLKAEFQVSDTQLGLLSTAFLWVYGLCSLPGGYLADRFSRKNVIIFSLVIWSLVTWATAHAGSFSQLLGARALMGVSEACYLPAALALIADRHGERTRSLATGLHQSGLYTGIILGGALGGWMGEHYGWRRAFTLLGVAGVVYAVIAFFGLKGKASEPATPPIEAAASRDKLNFLASVKELFSLRSFLILGVANSLAAIAFWIVYTWLPTYLYERFQMSLTGAGFSATFYIQSASFAGIILGGMLADRWSRTNPRARVFTQVIGFISAGTFLFLVGYTSSQAVLILSLIVFGLGRGFFDCNLMPVLCQIAPNRLRATGYGIFNFASCLVGGAMAALAGALKSTIGLGGALQISALILCAAGLTLLPIRLAGVKEAKSDRQELVQTTKQ